MREREGGERERWREGRREEGRGIINKETCTNVHTCNNRDQEVK